MARIASRIAASIVIIGLGLFLLIPNAGAAGKTLYIGGTMALTGAYAENTAATLAAYEDYAKYVNETKRISPWQNDRFPSDISIEVLWRDDELKPAKALSIYEELKSKGMLVFRVSSSPTALALKDRLFTDNMGSVSMAAGAFLLTPPQTIFTNYPIYTDSCGAIADWFKQNWKEARKPRVAYLTADNAMGQSIEIPEMKAFLNERGYEFVGTQYVPLIPTTPPTTQLGWLKEKKVDLALGVMINPGTQATIKEAVRLGMGPHLPDRIVFGFASTTQIADFVTGLGELGDGYVSGGSFPPYSETGTPGVAWVNELQKKYRGKPVASNVYMGGLVEAMTQVEALRLALKEVPFDKLTRADVLKKGFERIKNFDTGGLSNTPLTYGPGKIEGVDGVRVDQVQHGKVVKLGVWPVHHIYTK
jgi:branched-chain amino acid transport system substrate-binding protein